MSFLNDIVKVGTLGLVPDITGEDAAQAASDRVSAATDKGVAEERRQFDLTRSDLLPFLQAATGSGGALDKFVAGLEQAPGAPELEAFEFDPNTVLDNPNFQFIRDQGNIAANRLSAKNRQLGSGNRLIEAQKFGQGLASNFIGEEFGRQLTTNNQTNNRLLQQHSLGLQAFNDRLNRLGGLIDTGRGTGGTLGTIGANTASNISNLFQRKGDAQAAAELAESAGIRSLINTGVTAAGFAFGGPAGGVAANRLTQPATSLPGFTPIGAQDAPGFFS